MAYVLGQQQVKDTKEFNDYAYGITLPVRRGNTGYFEQGFTSFIQAKSNLVNLMKTNRGERVMQPDFGNGLREFLFDPMVDELETQIEESITKTVSFWLPYITIENIDVEMTDEMRDQHTANITLEFSVGNEITTDTVTFTIQD